MPPTPVHSRRTGGNMSASAIDPTFYRSPAEAAAAPPEELAYVAAFDPEGVRSDAMTVVDVNPDSERYGQVVGWTDVGPGHELHHFGWNACSSALKHEGHDMSGLARRYLLVPGIRSSAIHVLDTLPTRATPGWSGRSTPTSCRPGPATRARTPPIAGPTGCFSPAWAGRRRTPTVRPGSRCSTTRASTC